MQALAAYAEAHNPVLLIAREGQPFNKPADNATFLEPFLIPADTRVATLDGSRRRFWGDFQINIWTEDSIGAGAAEVIAEEIAQLFPVFPKTFDPVSIEAPASVKRAIVENGWRITPVMISYRMESTN
jgi:hypothetical protein